MSNLEIRNLSKNFGRVQALRDVSLTMHDGEFLVVLGPTGAGKTTTLRCVAGLEKPDEGSIFMDGKQVTGLSPAERDVAFVFQSYALYPRKTVFENMAFPLEARQTPQVEIDQRIKTIARKLDIDSLLKRRPAALSGGQQQRVALGRAMVRQPRIFLMDEPLTNLDFKLRVEMRAELKRLQKELDATFFYVTNDQVEAMSMADRVAILSAGRLHQIDRPENVYNNPANIFVAGFVGSPRMNFLDCEFDWGERVLIGKDAAWQLALNPAQIDQLERKANGSGLVFGVRPEDAELMREPQPEAVAGTVYVVEPLGDRSFVDLQLREDIVKVKVAPTFEAASGDPLWIRFDTERIHVFDNASGEILF